MGYIHYNNQNDLIHSKAGTYGEICTINPTLPDGPRFSAFYEWINSQLSWTYNYWVQVGYGKGAAFWPQTGLRYYAEWQIEGQPRQVYSTAGPSVNTWHSYATRHAWELPWEPGPKTLTEWRFYIDGTRYYTINAGPNYYQAIDEYSKAETASDVGNPGRMCLTGTHFKELKFYDPYNYYLYWEIHYPVRDPPCSLTETSHREFYASGGG